MKVNQNVMERIVREGIGLVLIWAVLYYFSSPLWIWTLSIIGLILIVTGLSGYCPLWGLLKIDTSKK